MRKFTITEKWNGEQACRNLSDKALKLYSMTDPFEVFEYEENNKTMYAYDGSFGYAEKLTFTQLETALEEFQDACEECDF